MRHVAEDVFDTIGFSKEWASRLKLVVDELYMNAVRYGSAGLSSQVEMFFEYDATHIQFSISDDGSGPEAKSAEELKTLIEQNMKEMEVTNTSGRGLTLIAQLWTDELDISPSPQGGITVRFSKKVEKTPPPHPPMIELMTKVPLPEEAPSQPEAEASKSTGPSITLKLNSELGEHSTPELTAPVDEKIESLPAGGSLVLDLADMDYINSTFIGNLAAWYNRIQAKKATLTLKNSNEQIQDVLDLVGLNRVLTFE